MAVLEVPFSLNEHAAWLESLTTHGNIIEESWEHFFQLGQVVYAGELRPQFSSLRHDIIFQLVHNEHCGT